MGNEIKDERYHVADEAIYDAFFMLLKEKELDKITVTEVIKKAGVVRSTFYNHYDNIPALAAAIEDKTLQDIYTLLVSFPQQNDRELCKVFYMAVCEYARTNPLLAGLLKGEEGGAFMEKAITMLHRYVSNVMESRGASYYDKGTYSYMIAGSIGSAIGILHKWIVEDFVIPAGDIADILTQIFMAGMLPLMS